MPSHLSKLFACQLLIVSLAPGACIAFAAPPDPPVDVTRVPVEFRVSVADLEKEVLRGVIQRIDPKAKPELPIAVKVNSRDLRANAADKSAEKNAKDAPRSETKEQPRPKMVVLPAPVQPAIPTGRPRLSGRPIGSRIIERAVIQPAIDMFAQRLSELPDLDYHIELRSFKLAIAGQTLTCEVGGAFHAEGKAPPALPGQRTNPPTKVRGDIDFKLTVTKELVWGDSGKLELKEGRSQIRTDPDVPIVGFPRFDLARVIRRNGLPTLLDGVVDRMVMKQLSGDTLPDLARVAPKVNDKLPFFVLAEITAYPLRSDGKDLYIPLTVGLVSSNKKTDDEVKVAMKTGTPPEPMVRGKIVFDVLGKPDMKLDPVK